MYSKQLFKCALIALFTSGLLVRGQHLRHPSNNINLSNTQRDAVNHFRELEGEGNPPPGADENLDTSTGKVYSSYINANETCSSPVIDALLQQIPSLILATPRRCCGYTGPITAYITHSQPALESAFDMQHSGFELFWDEIHDVVDDFSEEISVCYVMTGYDPSKLGAAEDDTLSNVLIAALDIASEQGTVSSIVGTVPTTSNALLTTIRSIWENPDTPFIAIMNTGYEHLQREAEEYVTSNKIVSESRQNPIANDQLIGRDYQIPYVGYLSDAEFGEEAGSDMTKYLQGEDPQPLCFNHRQDVEVIGNRCEAFYTSLGFPNVAPLTGVACNDSSTGADLIDKIDANTNAILSGFACCRAVSDAVASIKLSDPSRKIHVGCMDETEENQDVLDAGDIDFIVTQPIWGQAYGAASWASGPVKVALLDASPRAHNIEIGGTFPHLGSLNHMKVYTVTG